MNPIATMISNIGIVPVVKIEHPENALPIAHALSNGGIDCMEITFRTEHALSSIRSITKALPDMIVGAGTVTSIDLAKDAVDAGAQFIVTPGFNPDLVQWCIKANVPIIPGVQTPSEIESALRQGLTYLKFFPAESSGGIQKLKDLSGPYPHVQFMPSGGINIHNLNAYLALKNVFAVGASFMIPAQSVLEERWTDIEKEAAKCVETMLDYSVESIHLQNRKNALEKDTLRKLEHAFNPLIKCYEYDEEDKITICTPSIPRALYYLSRIGIKNERKDRETRDISQGPVTLDIGLASYKIQLVKKV